MSTTQRHESFDKKTAKNFKMKTFRDKAYLSKRNFEVIEEARRYSYIPFKSNTLANARYLGKMFHLFQCKRDEFFSHYHQRSNAESTI